MIAALCGVRLDARRARRSRDAAQLAQASRWIAANLCSIRGIRLRLDLAVPAEAQVIGIDARSFSDLLAALATIPALVDAADLPLHWQLALRTLGIPLLDRPAATAVVGGASVIVPLRAGRILVA